MEETPTVPSRIIFDHFSKMTLSETLNSFLQIGWVGGPRIRERLLRDSGGALLLRGGFGDVRDADGAHNQTPNPRPYTLHPTAYGLNHKPQTLNPQPSTLNPTPHRRCSGAQRERAWKRTSRWPASPWRRRRSRSTKSLSRPTG